MEEEQSGVWSDMWNNTNGIIEKIAVAAGAIVSVATAVILKALVWLGIPAYIVIKIINYLSN